MIVRRQRRPVAASWRALDDAGRKRMADRLLGGRYGALAYLARGEHHAPRRPDLAVKALRTAAELYAAVQMLGFVHDGASGWIDGLAARLGLEVKQ